MTARMSMSNRSRRHCGTQVKPRRICCEHSYRPRMIPTADELDSLTVGARDLRTFYRERQALTPGRALWRGKPRRAEAHRRRLRGSGCVSRKGHWNQMLDCFVALAMTGMSSCKTILPLEMQDDGCSGPYGWAEKEASCPGKKIDRLGFASN